MSQDIQQCHPGLHIPEADAGLSFASLVVSSFPMTQISAKTQFLPGILRPEIRPSKNVVLQLHRRTHGQT